MINNFNPLTLPKEKISFSFLPQINKSSLKFHNKYYSGTDEQG